MGGKTLEQMIFLAANSLDKWFRPMTKKKIQGFRFKHKFNLKPNKTFVFKIQYRTVTPLPPNNQKKKIRACLGTIHLKLALDI